MKDEEIEKFLLEDKQTKSFIQTEAIINVLVRYSIENGWFTEEEFNSLVEKTNKIMVQEALKLISEEERKRLESNIKLRQNPLFNMFF